VPIAINTHAGDLLHPRLCPILHPSTHLTSSIPSTFTSPGRNCKENSRDGTEG
jgi:hypothetical protein